MKVITIGRNTDNNVVICDKTVSRHHAQIIQHNDGRFSILDMNSKNGTFVNGQPITREVPLKRGDTIRIGTTNLQWEPYFKLSSVIPVSPKKSSSLPLIFGTTGGVLVTILIVALFLMGRNKTSGYRTDDINTQVLVSFSSDVSFSNANSWLKKHKARVLDSDAAYSYFLVCTEDEIAARKLVNQLEKSGMTDCVIRNQVLVPHSVKLSVLDIYGEPMSETEKISHGEMVAYTMTEGTNMSADQHQIKINGQISSAEMSNHFMDVCRQMSEKDLNIVNFSLGISKYKDKEHKILKERDEFIADYADDLRWYVNLANKCGEKNFVITKSMGNESEHKIDDAFRLAMEKMDDNQRQVLKDHLIIVAAKDTRKGLNGRYSNEISKKIDGVNTIMVDLSNLPIAQRGTSAAAPLVANWIAKSGLEDAKDVMKLINKSTQNGELVSEKLFAETAQKVRKDQNKEENKDKPIVVPTKRLTTQRPVLIQEEKSSLGPIYTYTISCDSREFNSGKIYSILLPNGYTMKYQYLYDDNYVGCSSTISENRGSGYSVYGGESFYNKKYVDPWFTKADHIYEEPMHYIAFWAESYDGQRSIACLVFARKKNDDSISWCGFDNGMHKLCHSDVIYEIMGLNIANSPTIRVTFAFNHY